MLGGMITLHRLGVLVFVVALGALVVAAPVAADPTTTWTAGPGAVGDDTYDGYIDLPGAGANVASGASVLVGGWVVDKQAQGWAGIDQIQVVQGLLGSGGSVLANGIPGQSRPDVGTALGNPFFADSGFSATINGGALKTGQATIAVYAHTPSKGWWYKQQTFNVGGGGGGAPAPSAGGGATKTAPPPKSESVPGGTGATRDSLVVAVESPKSGEQVHTDSDFTIMGYALDKSASNGQGVQNSGIDRVQIWMDIPPQGTMLGNAQQAFSSSNAASFGSQFANSGFRFTFKPTNFSVASHNLYVLARSAVNGEQVAMIVPINITDAPSHS
jgi:hypothetical protein